MPPKSIARAGTAPADAIALPSPPTRGDELRRLARIWGASGQPPLPVVLTRGEGAWVTDVEGHRYLDMMGPPSAMTFGHLHPELLAAARRQLSRLTLSGRGLLDDQLALACRALAVLLEGDLALPVASETDALTMAVLAARLRGRRRRGGSEGKLEVIGFASEDGEASKDRGRGRHGVALARLPMGDLASVRDRMGPATVGIVVEPLLAERVTSPPRGFLSALRQLCDQHDALLICDETQTGLGRTGELLDARHEDLRADITLVGHGLGGGIVPMCACVGSRDALGELASDPQTYAGHPLGAAVARATVELLEGGGLVADALELGSYFRRALRHPLVADVRGRGLLLAVELVDRVDARRVGEALVERGLLTQTKGANLLRLTPPLTILRHEIDYAVQLLHGALEGFSA